MIEAPVFAPTLINRTTPKPPRPNYANIPSYLIKSTDGLGMERARFLEERVQNIIASQAEIIAKVTRNEFSSEDDNKGRDLTVRLLSGITMHIQVKSSGPEIIKYKHEIAESILKKRKKKRQLMGQWAREAVVSDHMTRNSIILLNGSETKSDQEILESFLPQLKRIQRRSDKLMEQLSNSLGEYHARLTPKKEATQIFPQAHEQLTLLFSS